jgi:uncharacterized repeat protein (TIGR03803 family)
LEVALTRRPYRSLTAALLALLAFGLSSGASPEQLRLRGARGAKASPSYTILYRFQGRRDGDFPFALVTDKSGAFYGTTFSGGDISRPQKCGATGCGTVFKLTPVGSSYVESILYRFKSGTDGSYPNGSLVIDKNGALLGTTESGGGASGYGTVYKLTPTGRRYTESIVYRFQYGADGAFPFAALLVGRDGVLYGTTNGGGANSACPTGCGTVFELTPSGSGYAEKVLYRFQGGSDGMRPQSALIADGSGALYGTTPIGGSTVCKDGCGTAFRLTHTATGYSETVIYRFQGRGDGAHPYSGLIADGSGALYGTTDVGGYGNGTVYELAPSGSSYTRIILHDFKGGSDGIFPTAGLVMVGGALYGATYAGGNVDWGTVYKVASAAHETVLYTFQGFNDGARPFADLIVGNDGALYGTTSSGGGGCNCGTAFRISP